MLYDYRKEFIVIRHSDGEGKHICNLHTENKVQKSTTRTASVSSTTAASVSRRPFRVASRRRPAVTTRLTTTTTTTTQATTTTNILDSDEYLQDIEEADSIEDPTITTRSGPKKNPKTQRRPLVNLKEDDQNPSATNEEEKKRQSKKYSSTFKQNQLDEALKLKNQDAFDEDVDATTEGKFTESFSAETAVALAAHKLLEAPVPIIPDYEYDIKPTRSAPTRNTQKFKYTTTEYTPEITKTPSYPLSYSTTPNYSTETQDYVQTSTGLYSGDLLDTVLPSTGGYRGSKPTGFTAPTIINPGLSGVSRNLGPSTVRYLSTTEENIPTQEINPTAGRYTDTSEKYSKSSSRLPDLNVYNYSSISYNFAPRDKYINTEESLQTVTPTGRSRGRRPSTTISGLEQYTVTSQTLPPTNDFGISKKYSESSRPTTSANKYLDERYTGISEDPFETSKYLDTSDKYTDSYSTPGPSTIDYLDSNRYTGTSQNLNPRFTVGEKYTNPSTPTYLTEDITRVSQDPTPTRGYTETTVYSEVPANTRIPSRFTNRGGSYTTVQNLNPTTTYSDTTDRYSSISRRRKPSTTTVSDNDKYTTVTLQTTNPTTSNERYTEASRRRRPSTNSYTETDKYTTGTVQNVNPTEVVISTTEKPVQSRRRRPTTNSYTNSEQYTTETTTAFRFTGTSERYTSVPRRTRPSTSRYFDTVTEEASSEFQTAGPTTGFTGINDRLTEASPRLRPTTDSYIDTSDKSTDTPQIETYTVNNKKYSDISRNRSPSTSSYLESTEKSPLSSSTELSEDEVSTGRYLNPNGQYTGFIQDVNPSTVKYVSTEEKSQDVSPSSVQYPSTTGKYVSGPVDDFGFSTAGYSQSQDPSYFTREYLLASPVTKTYDDEYQYLSPVTTTQPTTTTRKLGRKKTIFRRISSTARPSSTTTTTTTTERPRRVVSRKPFEKIRKVQKVKVLKVPKKEQEKQLVEEEKPVNEVQITQRQQVQRVPVKNVESPKPNRIRKPITFDYYDDSEEKVAQKYEEGTKVILHSKGTIECLDIGNFPHPSSCKKFISCARMESGALLGWEYVCPKGLSFDPVGGICNWSAGLGCNEQDS
ncbi:mucin-5AC [Papilio machaon]|uniref:mucin-5AC n=1 Tax=Papilio machaon TaxID=76193 RepID=UPI001E6656A1|nr:mucin-5AC [Papilio machaon]